MNTNIDKNQRIRVVATTIYDDERRPNGLVPEDWKPGEHWPSGDQRLIPTDEFVLETLQNMASIAFRRRLGFNILTVKSQVVDKTNLVTNTNLGFTIEPGQQGFLEDNIELYINNVNAFMGQFASLNHRNGHPGFILKITVSEDAPRV